MSSRVAGSHWTGRGNTAALPRAVPVSTLQSRATVHSSSSFTGSRSFGGRGAHNFARSPHAGYHAVAMDLRGYGASDKTPRGYDLPSLADDVAAVIASLGAADAIVVAHDWGGFVGWTLANRHPEICTAVGERELAPSRSVAQRPRSPPKAAQSQRACTFDAVALAARASLHPSNAAKVDQLLHQWSAPGWPDLPTSLTYRRAFQLGNTPFCAAEYHRWLVRSAFRPDGLRYAHHMKRPISVPVLQVHGAQDRCFLAGRRTGVWSLCGGAVPMAAPRRGRALSS